MGQLHVWTPISWQSRWRWLLLAGASGPIPGPLETTWDPWAVAVGKKQDLGAALGLPCISSLPPPGLPLGPYAWWGSREDLQGSPGAHACSPPAHGPSLVGRFGELLHQGVGIDLACDSSPNLPMWPGGPNKCPSLC